jgi:hypothetical protein
MAGGFAQAGFLGAAATINGLEANGADPNVRFASRRKFFPGAGTLVGVELLTTKDTRHGWEVVVKLRNVKLAGSNRLVKVMAGDWA